MKGTRYRPDDYQEPEVDVWPEHWEIIGIYRDNATQWRVAGMGGIVGLDYTVFHHALERRGIKGAKFERMMADLQIIEEAALEILNKTT